jgi:Uncharacterised nucleotidyltransferase
MPIVDELVGLVRQVLRDEPPPGDPRPLPRQPIVLHGLVPVLAPAGSRIADPEDARWLEAAARDHALRALAATSSTVRAHQALADAGVVALALKGATLGMRTAGCAGGRAFTDVDVLVDPKSMLAADAALQKAGWKPSGASSTPFGGPYPRWAALVGHHTHYVHPREIDLELHWQAANAGSFPVRFGDLWERRRTFGVGGAVISGLGNIDELLQVATHAALHGFIRLAWLVDIARLLPAVRDRWPAVVGAAGAVGVARPLAVAVEMASALDDHGLEVPVSTRERALIAALVAGAWARMPASPEDLGDPGRWSRVRDRLRLRADLRYKGCVVAEALAPLDRLEASGLPPGRAFLTVAWEAVAMGHARARA